MVCRLALVDSRGCISISPRFACHIWVWCFRYPQDRAYLGMAWPFLSFANDVSEK